MIPVRSEREVVLGESVRGEFRDEHGRNSVQGCTALLLDACQGCSSIKERSRNDNCASVGDGAQIAHHHAEAVVEGHR